MARKVGSGDIRNGLIVYAYSLKSCQYSSIPSAATILLTFRRSRLICEGCTGAIISLYKNDECDDAEKSYDKLEVQFLQKIWRSKAV
jgi:hypothetical protein